METTEEKLDLCIENHQLCYCLKVPFDEFVGFWPIPYDLNLQFGKENGQWRTGISDISVHLVSVSHFLCRNNHLTLNEKTTDAVNEVLKGVFKNENENDTRWEVWGNYFKLMLFTEDLERLSGKCFKSYFDKDMAEAVANNGLRYVKQLLDTADSAVRKWASKNEWAKEKTNEVAQD